MTLRQPSPTPTWTPRRAAGRAAVLAAALLGPAVITPAHAAEDGSFPEPALASRSWSLDLQPRTPAPIAVETPAGQTRWYWYLPYQVTNHTGEDRLMLPQVTVMTDRGTVIEANVNIPPAVYDAIASRLRNRLLERPEDVVGTIRQGPDFARESVAIWPVPAEDVDEMTVFIAGLSGETAPLLSPSTGQPVMETQIDPFTGQLVQDEQGNPLLRPVLARRTTLLRYATPGTPDSPQQLPVELLDRRDVMR